MRLHDRVILVTGAAKGLGRAMAEGMAAEGAAVMLADIDIAEAETVAAVIAQKGQRATAFNLDVSDGESVARVVAAIQSREGRIDVLVNNAGIAATKSFFDTSEAEWDRVMRINLKSVFHCCQAVLPAMTERRRGKVINVASVAAKVGGGLLGTTTYAASKAGMIGLSKGLAREFAPFGITVNTIAPGSITTPLTYQHMTPKQMAASVKRIPLGRRGTPEDMVGAAVFLASPESDFITGATIDVNGGILMD
ncbi:3-oxoacyl-(acyl-carrier-protein) reductase FabG [uncultured delta proteobacterium]|uniref:3-oxoacyl-(Acyl-carrier-protein) reductase FabG n=1 Tax=uncultured delta proteobacterium TaxID=34034 RepID=A0A212JDA9_9DELT|nr:3-oxoacyl-(acyl-carrier-protein) reductase FabG [uncultured delta proteobacterium]